MLFNSYEFIFLFLPLTIIGSYFTQKYLSQKYTLGLLVLASLIFYAHHVPEYLMLMVSSIVFNYICAIWIKKMQTQNPRYAFSFCGLGVAVNLGLLAYFKYADFFIETLSYMLGAEISTLRIVLPIAISFYTFQQIAYLIDVYKRASFKNSDHALFKNSIPFSSMARLQGP